MNIQQFLKLFQVFFQFNCKLNFEFFFVIQDMKIKENQSQSEFGISNLDIILKMIMKRFCIKNSLFHIIQSKMNHISFSLIIIEYIYINYLSIDMNLDILLQSYLWWSSRASSMTFLQLSDFHLFFSSAFLYHNS